MIDLSENMERNPRRWRLPPSLKQAFQETCGRLVFPEDPSFVIRRLVVAWLSSTAQPELLTSAGAEFPGFAEKSTDDMGVRFQPSLWEAFTARCAAAGVKPSPQLNRLMAEFIHAQARPSGRRKGAVS